MKRSIPTSLTVAPGSQARLRSYMLLCNLAGKGVTEWTANQELADLAVVDDVIKGAKRNFPSRRRFIDTLALFVKE